MASGKVRGWRGGRVQWVYYSMLATFTIWAFVAVGIASPMTLFKVLANVAGLVLAIAGVQIFWVNRRFLPRALRPPLWREALLLACAAFYAFFSFFVLRGFVQSWAK
jgi:hypothetical protein